MAQYFSALLIGQRLKPTRLGFDAFFTSIVGYRSLKGYSVIIVDSSDGDVTILLVEKFVISNMQFSDYTQDQEAVFANKSLEDSVAEIEARRKPE